QPLGALGDRRIVDRLDIDAVFLEQDVGGLLQFSGSPTNSGTIWVSLDITGRPAEVRIALTRAARSWWRARSQSEVFRWRIAAVAAEQIAGGSAVVKMKPGA